MLMDVHNKLADIYALLKDVEPDVYRIGLLGGGTGPLLFCLHYAAYRQDTASFDQAMQQVEHYLENIEVDACSYTFCDGLAGFGWFIEYIVQQGWLDVDTNEILAGIDDFLHQAMIASARADNYDFLHGAVGVGIYFMSRSASEPTVRKYVADLIHVLHTKAVVEDSQCMKWPPVEFSTGDIKQNEFDLGLSHGIPSILSFLTKAYQRGICEELSLRMVEQTTNYVLKQRLSTENHYSCFPNSVKEEIDSSRLAWCYGDPGICCALWQAAGVLKKEEIRRVVKEVMIHAAARRHSEETHIVDAGLCHGTAGVAHVFRRFYDWTGEPALYEAAEHWYRRTIEMATFSDGLAGYKTFSPPAPGGWLSSANLLEGIAGIGLSLLYPVSNAEPAWEEALLIR